MKKTTGLVVALLVVFASSVQGELVASWHLDGNTSDSSGRGNDGTVYGASYEAGYLGLALRFDGQDDYVDCGSDASLKPTDNITIGLWVKPGPTQNTYADILGGHQGDQGYVIQQDGSNTNRYYFAYNQNGTWQGWQGDNTTTQLTAEEWQHFVVQKEGSTIKHSLNGSLSASGNVSGTIFYTLGQPFYLGIGYELGSGRYFTGVIDEVTIEGGGSYGPTPTPEGFGTAISPIDTTTGSTPITLTFEQVTVSGGTTLTTFPSGPPAPAGYLLGNSPVFYDVTTTATYIGQVQVCISYSGISFAGPPESLRLMRYENGQWIDATTAVNTGNHTICGAISALLPLAIMLAEEPVNFADANLKQAVKEAIGITSDPTPSDMLALYWLEAPSRGITSLTGLEYALNLEGLRLSANHIIDIGPLSGLTHLRDLRLENNQITSIPPLPEWPELQSLYLHQNQISDISPLAGLTSLTILRLYNNQISDISPLAGLTSLSTLELFKNQISDVTPLSGLTYLRTLNLYGNYISDVSALSGLTNLNYLSLEVNQLSNVDALSGMTRLTTLYLGKNQIANISALSGMISLRYLYLNDNQIADISPLSDKVNLRTLRLNGNQVSDISSLSGLILLTELKLQYNQISDMSPVVDLTALRTLDLGVNPITAVPSLPSLSNLTYLGLYSCAVNSISDLSGLTSLQELNLYSNQVADLSALTGLTSLQTLHLELNQIVDVTPLTGLINLRLLELESNQIMDVTPLAGLTNLDLLYVYSNQLTDASSLAGLTNLKSLALSWNQITDFSWLSSLPGLTLLSVEGNPISDISFLQNLTALQTLWAGNDQVVDITLLASLIQLRQLYLEGAHISDISALTSLTNLLELRLAGNPLGCEAYSTDIPLIQANNPGLALTVDPIPYNCQPNPTPEGHILFEYFYGTDSSLGSLLALPAFPDSPDRSDLRTSFEGPTNWRSNYGTRARGYLYPPQTGSYTFWIASDDQSQLWLSADEDPANAVQIASVPGWTPARDFDNTGGGAGGPEQQSSPIYLEAGRRYYIEALCVQGTGGDNLAVAWQGPSIPIREVISGTFLSAWIEDSDGVSSEVEDGAPNDGDGNADGVPDSQQSNVASLPNAVDGQYVTLVSSGGPAVQDMVAIENPSPADAPPGVQFPVGFFDFTLSGMGVGGSATVTIILPVGQTIGTYYKYGPTPDNPDNHWYEFLYDGTTGAEISLGQIVLHFVDGLRGDDDLTANGLITEPGGPSALLINHAPEAAITGPSSGLVVPVGTTVALAGTIVDQDPGDGHTAEWTITAEHWTGPLAIDGIVAEDLVTGQATFVAAGIYSISLTVTDTAGASGMTDTVNDDLPAFVVVYDPEGGCVTGGGWMWSPVGPHPYMAIEGKASFGFVSKYQNGATVPTGNTEFQFRAGDLNFHSTSYDWLVVTGSSHAKFKGTGSINGSGNYKFQIWAGDSSPDTLRIKIWTEDPIGGAEIVEYDNGFAGSGYENGQPIGGGSIVIHTE